VKVKKTNVADKLAAKVILFALGLLVGLVMEECLKIGFVGRLTGE